MSFLLHSALRNKTHEFITLWETIQHKNTRVGVVWILLRETRAWLVLPYAQNDCLRQVYEQGRSEGGARGELPPQNFAWPPPVTPLKFSAWRHATALKSYTDHWQLPLLQNWPLQWPPQMKMSGSAPARDPSKSSSRPCKGRNNMLKATA